MSKFIKLALAGAASLAFLSACGGGGSDTPAPAPVVVSAFPLQAGYKARIQNGSVEKFIVSGDCSGFSSVSSSPPSAVVGATSAPVTFEGAPALAATAVANLQVTDCTPSSAASETFKYYDSNTNYLGHSTSKVEYGVASSSPLPSSVKIGDKDDYGTEIVYADSTKQATILQRNYSYVIEADGASTSTAIANLILKDVDAATQLVVFTQQSRNRIAADGTLTTVSVDVQNSSAIDSTHLLYTAF